MIKCKALNDITYKDIYRKIDTIFDVEDKDIYKLLNQGAVMNLEPITEPITEEKTKVEINVIKNPVKAKEEIKADLIFDGIEIKPKVKVIEKPKRKYNKRKRIFGKRK